MLKRNTDLVIKLLLFIFLVILLVLVLYEANRLEQSVEAKTIIMDDSVVMPHEELNLVRETSVLEKIKKCEKEYYYATNVWKYLRQRNFSQAAACGIIGNMMIETSGGTLDLKPYVYSKSGNYYGLCQWSKKYYSGAFELPFEYQLDYLLGTISLEFKTFGWLYKDGYTLEDFLVIEDPEEAAFIFAKVYERCGQASYEMRKKAASKAYEYFNIA